MSEKTRTTFLVWNERRGFCVVIRTGGKHDDGRGAGRLRVHELCAVPTATPATDAAAVASPVAAHDVDGERSITRSNASRYATLEVKCIYVVNM